MIELQKALKNNNNAKTPDPAGLPPKIPKFLSSNFLHFLLLFFNFLFLNYKFPSFWKFQKIILIPKNSQNTNDPTNYRPISLTHLFAKLYEKIISNRIVEVFIEHKLISPNQHGGIPNQETQIPLTQIIQQIQYNQTQSQYTQMIVYDISKTFDSVWHKALIYKLYYYFKLRGPILIIFILYFTNRKAQVYHDNKVSDIITLQRGAPQGTNFGLLSFLLFTK